MKHCCRCNTDKEMTEFNRDFKNKDGLRYDCRDCQREVRRNWYLRNRAEQIAAAKSYSTANPEKKKEWDKIYRSRNKQKISDFKKTWYFNNHDREKGKRRAYYQSHPKEVMKKVMEWGRGNRDKVQQYKKRWALENKSTLSILSILRCLMFPEARAIAANKYAKKATKQLTDNYIKTTLRNQKVPKEAMGDKELIELKREILKIKRSLKID